MPEQCKPHVSATAANQDSFAAVLQDTEWFENKRSKRGGRGGGGGGGGARAAGQSHNSNSRAHGSSRPGIPVPRGPAAAAIQHSSRTGFAAFQQVDDLEELSAAAAAFGSAARAAAAAGGIDGLLNSSSIAAAVPVLPELEGLALEEDEGVEVGVSLLKRATALIVCHWNG